MSGSVSIPAKIETLSGVAVDSALAVERIEPIHRVQLTTYPERQPLPLGRLITFNAPLIKNGINRILNLDFRS